jgi:uncharacterized NAD(P)/FAD-binding protein YdhS
MKTVLIIGAGYSGAIMAALLLEKSDGEARHLLLVNGSGKVARGMAYGTQSPDHTLNVPAGNMSAFDDDPQHFLRFAQRRDSTITSSSFVARSIYGDYLEQLLAESEAKAPAHATLERVTCHVTRLEYASNGQSILAHFENGDIREVDQVVLALGHFASANPRINNMAFYDSERFIRDPWNQSRLSAIGSDQPVLLLGTGLTAVDVAMTLQKQAPARKIHAVSRRGMLPQYHRRSGVSHHTTADQSSIWGDACTVREQMRALRRYCDKLEQSGGDWREALAILRPVTAGIWQRYDERERRRFVRHVQPYWDSHRHRLAPNVASQIDEARKVGLFQASAGRVLDLHDRGDHVEAVIQPRGGSETRLLHIGHVVNCTGPSTNLLATENTLVQQLLADGMIRPDNLGLGLDVSDACAVIDAKGAASDRIFYIGPWLKAKYWEATAVPDLRRFARQLAQALCND